MSDPSGTRVIVVACTGVDLAEVSDAGVRAVIDDPLFMVSAAAWLDDRRVVVSSTDPRLPIGEVLDSRIFAVVDVETGEPERFVRTRPQVSVDVAWPMVVTDGRYVVAPVIEGAGGLSDIARIDLRTGVVEWVTRTPEVAERAAAPVPGGMLVAAEGRLGERPRMEFVPEDGPPVVLAEGLDIDTIQVMGGDFVFGGTQVSTVGVFKVWVADLAGVEGGFEFRELMSGLDRFPFVEGDGATMLVTGWPERTGEPHEVFRRALDLGGA